MKGFLAFSFLFLTQVSALAETPSAPKLFFEYIWLYDSNCSVTPERKIDPAWVQEARDKTPDFIKIWEQAGPVLFGKVFEIFGSGFQRKELTATLSVCPAPSYSSPLVLNVTRFLKSYMKDRPVFSNDAFADLVFHELLHTWVGEHLDWPTPLIVKYKDEAPSVRSHLHLMAMQIYIYKELKRDDLLQMIDYNYRNMTNPVYARAWEIVSNVEGYQAFIAEIKKK